MRKPLTNAVALVISIATLYGTDHWIAATILFVVYVSGVWVED